MTLSAELYALLTQIDALTAAVAANAASYKTPDVCMRSVERNHSTFQLCVRQRIDDPGSKELDDLCRYQERTARKDSYVYKLIQG